VLAELFWSQWAAIDSCGRGITDGTSAQFTNQFVPDATVRASLHPASVRSENLRAALSPARSIQLSTTRFPCADNCGWPLLGAAGDVSGETSSVQFVPVELTCELVRVDTMNTVSRLTRTAMIRLTGPPQLRGNHSATPWRQD
jgi:hypothetical protein